MKPAANCLAIVWIVLATHAVQASSEPVVVVHREDVIYGRKFGMALTMDVFTPQKANGAGIIFLVCGGWHSAHDSIHPEFFAELLKRGYTVFAVVHGSQPRFTIPENQTDINRAVRFIRYHAGDYHVDQNRLGITGGSAGGQLALLQGTAADKGNAQSPDPVERTSSCVQAVACFLPLTDLLNYGAKGKVMLGDGVLAVHKSSFDFSEFDSKAHAYIPVTSAEKKGQILRQISPITHVSASSPPTLIIHGEKDEVVPLQQSESILAKLREAGVPTKLILKKDAGHGWPDFWQKDMPLLADWFDRYLKQPKR